MKSGSIRIAFIKYFKKQGHTAVPSSSLWPHDDPSVLLTTAGMQQFKSSLMGEKDPREEYGSRNLTSVQRCFRTSDIESVGDPSHNTFFEMLGNFSVGGYFKQEAIHYAWEFITRKMDLPAERLWATYFNGDEVVAEDLETKELWSVYLPLERIVGCDREENWWGPPGTSGPCGPSSELHYDFTGEPCDQGDKCRPNCGCGRFMELWNLVFMQYHMNAKGTLRDLPTKNIDTGMGLERLAMVLQRKKNIFETDLFADIMRAVKDSKSFGSTSQYEDEIRARIVTDHVKATVMLLSDGVVFSNKEQGYIARRVYRRALDQFLHPRIELETIINAIYDIYGEIYPHLIEQKDDIVQRLQKELASYSKVLNLNIDELVQKITNLKHQTKQDTRKGPAQRKLSPKQAFTLYTTYGLSPERIKRKGYTFDKKAFNDLVNEHQEKSRSEKKFGGHGIQSSEWSHTERESMKKLHTATHLLHEALRRVLGKHVRQQGSDINPERLRFDFEHPAKLTGEEKQKIQELVNEQIKKDLPVTQEQIRYQQALNKGALAFFKEKYPDTVSVYSVGDFSKELCGGPHVTHTGSMGHFKITSEKSSSAGIRRIKAVLENN